MRVGITRQIACMQCDPTPRHAFHVRHLCPLIDAGSMMNLFFQDGENASWGAMPWSASTDTRPRDADTVAIHICRLLSNTGHDQQGSFRSTFRFPNVFARL